MYRTSTLQFLYTACRPRNNFQHLGTYRSQTYASISLCHYRISNASYLELILLSTHSVFKLFPCVPCSYWVKLLPGSLFTQEKNTLKLLHGCGIIIPINCASPLRHVFKHMLSTIKQQQNSAIGFN